MSFNLRNRHFLKLLDFTPQEIKFLLDLSMDLKKAKYAGIVSADVETPPPIRIKCGYHIFR